MKRVKRFLVPWFGVVLLAGCGSELEVAEQLSPDGTPFSQSLYEGYIDLSRAEYEEGDYTDSDSFAERAITAAGGVAPQPENIESRRLPAEQRSALTEARNRLLAVLDGGGAEKLPSEAATAQILFDCWMQEQEENRQAEDIEACRGGFFTALAYLEDGLAQANVAATEAAEPVQAAAVEPIKTAPVKAPVETKVETKVQAPQKVTQPPGRFTVYFDLDQAKLSQEAIATLVEVVMAASEKKGTTIRARGHTDSSGQSAHNKALAQKRVEAVAKFLIESGVDKERIETLSLGPAQPAVDVPSGTPEAKNRRVEIQFAPSEEKISGTAPAQ